MIIPVIRAIKLRHPHWDIEVLGLTSAGKSLRRAGIVYFGFSRLLNANDLEAINHGKFLAQDLSSGQVPLEESIAYLGLSFADLVEQFGVEEAAQRYKQAGRQAFLPIQTMCRAIRMLEPDLVVTTSSPRAEKAAVIAAGHCGVPSICLVDLFAIKEVEWVGQNGFASRVCVISDFVRDRLMSAGRNATDIAVTGNPAFDRLAAEDLPQNGQLLRDANGWNEKFVVLWASQREPPFDPVSGSPADVGLPQKVESELRRIVRNNNQYQLVIRYHPNQDIETQNKAAGVSYSTQEDDLVQLLSAVNCVITFSSTVGLEALLLRKPLLTVDLSVTCHGTPYSEMGYSVGVKSLGAIESALQEIRTGRHNAPLNLPRPGSAARRVVEEIDHVIGQES